MGKDLISTFYCLPSVNCTPSVEVSIFVGKLRANEDTTSWSYIPEASIRQRLGIVRTVSLLKIFYIHYMSNPKRLCEEIRKYFSELNECFDCQKAIVCQRCKYLNTVFCFSLRCDPLNSILTNKDNEKLEKIITTEEKMEAVKNNAI
ncbi:unnamed protein product [Lepeophtheirus salmonis]|uniref:(salmon louse) hypothetical protein n=1 Tax=Lepeophtheirus salmonis TaxID=72036 RepID=A0A7R8CAK6_LEPSM|nr:unnamed protein product [Lepeophtheirus salmonis]CAF2750449.1 unnamed protein product [Lepeophtheirus salmonis]